MCISSGVQKVGSFILKLRNKNNQIQKIQNNNKTKTSKEKENVVKIFFLKGIYVYACMGMSE